MDIKIRKIAYDRPETVDISCHEITESIRQIVMFVKSRQGQITGLWEGRQYEISISDICYVEAVDNRVFIYCTNMIYETRQKLYELEEILCEKYFLRISKSCILNLMKVKFIKPAMNGRFTANLQNGEEIIISRKYVPDLKKKLKGE